ncbi:histidine kinase [Arenibacter certesii]|uniref:Histidine kinase n=2 Tax=Arenibacter certesii TaxID=228955 RepID=A0A918MNT2_9FLAO|nr:histidine kinase [Arenibacter certesii]
MGRFEEGFNYDRALQEYYRNMVFSLILYMVNAYWIQYLIVKHKKNILAKRPLIIAIAGNIVLSMLGIFMSRFILKVGMDKMAFNDFLSGERVGYYKVSMLIALFISILFYVVWFFKYRQENRVKEQKIIAGTASAKFDALKNQLDPHFLFNSLNVLTSLIEEDPVQAQKFTTSLSKVYRYVLEQKNKDLVTVDEELTFAKTYIKLLRMRFEDSIVLDIPAQSCNPEAKIVPLSLQLLLENAVKHNVVTAERPLRIRVYEEEGMLCVSNNYQAKRVVKKSSGVGLKNIQQRYQILSKRVVQIEKTTSEFTVKLPLLTAILNNVETQELIIAEKRYKKAKERVEALKSFYGNLGAYIVVTPFLIILNYNTTTFPWAIFPALGWGFGVIMHGLDAYGRTPVLGKGWEERTMRKLMEDDDF